jgi:hypothetical protein
MKKILLVSFLLLFTVKIFAQQFALYNTGTLYDSFENVSQRAFTPDTSKRFAFNFFIPNFNANFFVSGNAQASLKSRTFLYKFNNDLIPVGQGNYNLANADGNAYLAMFKMYASIDGDVEVGFSAQTRAEGRGLFSDESIALFHGTEEFQRSGVYNNIFNSHYYYQTYNQLSFTYRERIGNKFAFGVKLSGLLGVEYQKVDINSSKAVFYSSVDSVKMTLQGTYQSGFNAGYLTTRDYLPTFRNPGASITIGTSYRTDDGFLLQANVKDLGFIHWSSRSQSYNFNSTATIRGIGADASKNTIREDSVYNKIYDIIHTNNSPGAFVTPVNGKAELSINKSFWVNDDKTIKYSPTLVASKELFYTGFVAGLVNPVQYKNYTGTVTFAYDDLKTFNVGAQFLLRSENIEFYVGSDKIFQSVQFLSQALNPNSPSVLQNSAYTGASVYLGFAVHFGPIAEHPMNASTIPTGEPGFLARLWARLFKTNSY